MKDGTVFDAAGVRRHLETYLLPMIAAFQRDGYRAELEGSQEPGNVLVGPDGTLHKTSTGSHRFVLARRYGAIGPPGAG